MCMLVLVLVPRPAPVPVTVPTPVPVAVAVPVPVPVFVPLPVLAMLMSVPVPTVMKTSWILVTSFSPGRVLMVVLKTCASYVCLMMVRRGRCSATCCVMFCVVIMNLLACIVIVLGKDILTAL